ncbi:FAD-binding protein [Leucobacter sp. CSA1]|uniref:FAD-binding protein n=1 Tax=Leucobacter chromiisoli TaxID=2796471 RepID=A0A934Q997_9MICO|nr:FAD-binding and (Fe-S)-binding domain-containing protein [Leucobacter chromiisoli]MBK0420113.1 FAD-binding protein [Leucobacter chromiisoli]
MGVSTTGSEGARSLIADLRAAVDGEVDASSRRRAEYSSDASNYRVVPEVVVFPRDADDAVAVVELALATGTPLTSRGAGTSVAGNAVGPGIVMDFSRHMHRILELDPEARTAVVEPGAVMGALQRAARPHGLRFGPDPSTWARCTIGGMIGNNACGSHSLSFGRTVDNVLDLDVVDGRGRRFRGSAGIDAVEGLEELVRADLATIRTELGRFGRQVSGYSLEHLLPEHRGDLTKALVGTEGTCVVALEATVSLVESPFDPVLLVLGYPSMIDAADAVPALLAHRPGAIEGLDARLVDTVRRRHGAGSVAALPDGAGWLLVELSGEDRRATMERAERVFRDSGAVGSRVFPDARSARPIWRIREDGVGLAGRTPEGKQAWPGFEDAAVPAERLGAYLRDLDELLVQHGVTGMPYGHFGDGCIHLRLDLPLEKDGAALRAFMEDGARLVAAHGGSISGEHGDGRARSELLSHMYSSDALRAFAGFKGLFDPRNLLNPGVIVDPAPLDLQLRRPAALPMPTPGGFSFSHDDGDFTRAVHRCVGVGKCRVADPAVGGFMCPSYRATADEKDSTRGRARVLQEMANGSLVVDGWRSQEVEESLDLCLSCKACSSDCPAGVDMATYKAETLYRRYRGRLRPVNHYVLGWLPRWTRLAAPFAGLVNAAMRIGPLRRIALPLGGMDARREVPRFAERTFTAERGRGMRAAPESRGARTAVAGASPRPRVLLWTDTFSDHFSPPIAHAAVSVLEACGFEVLTPQRSVCCGLTWISTGQLDGARARLGRLLDELHPYVDAGIPVMGLEPSCTAVLRSDLPELFPDDPRAAGLAARTLTLAELLSAHAPAHPRTWAAGSLAGWRIVVQPHCHQYAVMGYGADAELLRELGAEVRTLGGCCGLAGNFGMERGHYEVSVAVAEQQLLPALRELEEGDVFLADGFSCRTQAGQLAGAEGVHLAELLAATLR